jgi:hypothetical protein
VAPNFRRASWVRSDARLKAGATGTRIESQTPGKLASLPENLLKELNILILFQGADESKTKL